MLKNKEDTKIEQLMNEKGYSHAEAMAAAKKKDPNKETKGSDAGESEVSTEGSEICLPSNLLPEVSVGKEVSFHLTGEVTRVENEMVYVDSKDFSVSVREPYKEKDSVKALAVH